MHNLKIIYSPQPL